MKLSKDDVWKYGETSSETNRYSRPELDAIGPGGVSEFPIYHGNRVQIKIAEKIAIYTYFIDHGHLPPGNKIFR